MGTDDHSGSLNPAALPLPDAARLFTTLSGTDVSEAMLAADRDAGAPLNTDGTLNLVSYAAWLVREEANGHT